ncbi:MAG: Division initiation protein, partial [uncultured Quadrisphaera sp.]
GPAPEPAPEPEPEALTGRQRLLAAMRPRATRAQLLSGLLCLLLGLALVTQLRERSQADLASLRQSELIALLDDTTERADRLQQEVRDLTGTRDQLLSSSDQSEAARELARERLDVLGVLAGTVPATGPGIELTITGGEDDAEVLLAAVQEMRDAGAEAIQLGDVRVVASTYFVDADVAGGGSAVEVDGTVLEAPYTFRAIGSAATLASAMEFPGGVIETAALNGGTAVVVEREVVEVTALREVQEPAYARPADPPTDPPTAASP